MTRRPRHLERGWCWRCDVDGEPSVWGIAGHHGYDEAVAIVSDHEGEPVAPSCIYQDWRRTVPCAGYHSGRGCPDAGDDCSGTHLEVATGPGRGAVAYTWVEATP